MQPDPNQESYLRLFEELGCLHGGLRATWEPDLPQPLDDHRTHRQLLLARLHASPSGR
ncbi:MAG: hypothetical protein ACREQM_21190 [Candidatus Dormibacteraceae bacterium]